MQFSKIRNTMNNIMDFFFYLMVLLFFFLIFWILKLKKELHKQQLKGNKYKESEKRFRTLFDIAPMFIDTFDKEGKCLLWNKECERIFGWSKDEINASENSMSLFYPDTKDQDAMIEAFTARTETQFIELSPLARNGESIHSMWANVNLPDGETIFIGVDMRKQKDAEEKLLQIQSKLQNLNATLQERVKEGIVEIQIKETLLVQQARFAQMGEMIAMIAHQWRQPLSVISMTAFGIENKLDLNSFKFDNKNAQETFLVYLRVQLQDIEKYTQYLTGTIEDFSNYFKPNKMKEYTTLNIPVEKALSMLKMPLKDIDIQTHIETDTPIEIYTYEMMQVLLNIISNCIDIFNEKHIVSPKIVIDVTEDSQSLSIKICDNAGGIKESLLNKIFDPYFSTKDNKNGTGIGLYMSKILIENHSGGSLLVRNKDKGACFEIRLGKSIDAKK